MRNKSEEVGRLHKKLDNLQQLANIANIQMISDLIQGWCDDRPDNEQLISLRGAWLKTILYINKLEMDRDTYSIAYSDLMGRKNTEIERLGELLTQVTNENIELDQDMVK